MVRWLTCRPLGEVQAVCVVHFGASGFLTGDHLSSVSTAEALVLPFFGQHHLLLPPAVASPLQLTTFIFRWRLVLFGDNRNGWGVAFQENGRTSARVPHLRPDAQEAAAVRSATFTHRLPVSQTLQVVVEGEFCA